MVSCSRNLIGLSKLIIPAVLGSVLLAGCRKAETKSAPPPPPPPAVEVYVTKKETVPHVLEHIGQTDASQTVDVRARVTGVLLQQGFQEGTTVTQGDFLFRIDPRPFEADLQIAEARLLQAQVDVDAAKRDLNRSRQLIASNSISKEDLDDAVTKYNTALAAVKLAEANVYKARLELSYTTVTATIDGKIGRALKRPGDLVDDGSNSLLVTITRQDPIFVNFFVSEREMLDYRRSLEEKRIILPPDGNLDVVVTLLDGTVYPEKGQINFYDVKIDPQTGTALVRAELPNRAGLLVPGQFVKVHLKGAARPGQIMVPQRAVQMGLQGPYVYVVGEENKVEMRPVKTSNWEGKSWIIESGLREGERIIVNGVQKARPGNEVNVTTVTTTLTEPPLSAGDGQSSEPNQGSR